MNDDRVRSVASARLRLDARVLRQAEGLARSAGVSVSELIELLLLGLLDAEAETVMSAPRREAAPQTRVGARKRGPARILVLDDFRRRAASSRDDRAGPPGDLRARASKACRRAAQARARSVTAREAAGRARERARRVLEDLERLLAHAA